MTTTREPNKRRSVRAASTQRKQAGEGLHGARAALEEQLASFRSIFEAGSEGYIIHDDGIIIEVNPQFEELLGYKGSELAGQSIMKLVAEESRPLVAERLRTRPRKLFEIVGLKRDGTRIQLEVVGKPHLHKGREVGVVTVRDITERKWAEEALRESAEWLRLAAAAGGVGTFDWDIEKNTAKCSDQYFRLFGLDPNPRVSLEEFLELVHEDDVERVQEAVNNTLERDAPYATEYRVRRPDGSIHWISDRARVLKDDEGRPIRFHGAITDITERKQAEEALQQSREELELKVEADVARGNAYGLTFRELTVLHLVAAGRADKEIASELGISPHTASKHVKNIMSKMKAMSRTDAGVRAVREELIS